LNSLATPSEYKHLSVLSTTQVDLAKFDEVKDLAANNQHPNFNSTEHLA
jgi:hypothetical protein